MRIEESELQKGEASVEYMKNTCTKENVNHITSDDSQDQQKKVKKGKGKERPWEQGHTFKI